MFEKVRMMELYIETLTGTAFELRVSPYETIHNVKTRIQKLEGIAITQQHLIWQNAIELEDDYCLQDYGIHDGATLKLVLNMRGGPINTRRIPYDDPAIREMAEYFSEANRDEIMDRPGNRPVTVIVYHNGEQLNFFKIVDRDSTSPLSETLSGASVEEEEEEEEEEEDEDVAPKGKVEENDKTREKMKKIRSDMEKMTITKKPKKHIPRPPSSGRPCSKNRYWRLNGAKYAAPSTLNKNPCLPPLGHTLSPAATSTYPANSGPVESSVADGVYEKTSELAFGGSHGAAISSSSATTRRRLDAIDSAKLKSTLSSVKENQNETAAAAPESAADPEDPGDALETILRKASRVGSRSPRRWEFSQEVLLKDGAPSTTKTTAAAKRDGGISSAELHHRDALSMSPPIASRGLERLLSQGRESSGPGRPTASSGGELYTRPTTTSSASASASASKPSSKYGSERRQGVILESLNPSEVRAVSGVISTFVRSASKSRAGFTLSGMKDVGRITPEGRMMSARLQRLSASRDGRILSPKHLPPVVKKKKSSSKRCYVCSKKTGLASSYPCRCDHNYCATHRYPESHDCNFDYKTEGRKLLEQSNPVVSAPKLPKI